MFFLSDLVVDEFLFFSEGLDIKAKVLNNVSEKTVFTLHTPVSYGKFLVQSLDFDVHDSYIYYSYVNKDEEHIINRIYKNGTGKRLQTISRLRL